jgi:hypothetical protein
MATKIGGIGDSDWGDTGGGGDGDGDHGDARGNGVSPPASGDRKWGAVNDYGCGFGTATDGNGRSKVVHS